MNKIILVIKKFTSVEGELFRYAFSYSLLLALFPGIFLGVYLYQNAILNINELLDFLYLFLPSDLINPFVDYLMTRNQTSFLSTIFSVILSIGIASQSFYSFLILCANDEDFSTWNIVLRIKAIGLFIMFVGGLIIITGLLFLFPIHKEVIIPLVLLLFFEFFYTTITFRKHHFLHSLRGAAFSTIAILLFGTLFFWVIQEFTDYENIYGPLSNVVILFLAVYVLSNIVYFGYCINVVYRPINKRPLKWNKLVQRLNSIKKNS